MEDKSLIQLIPIFWKRKGLILAATIGAAILTSVVMLLQPNYYRSSAIFYPASSMLLEPGMDNNQTMEYYGDDKDVDRLLSMAKSSDLINGMIEEYKLGDHYDIDDSTTKGKIKLLKKFKKLYRIQKTEFDAIDLSIEDQDPAMAQTLTQAALSKLNEKANDVIRKSQTKMKAELMASFTANNQKLQSISDSLQIVRKKHGIYDTETQGEALTNLEIKSPTSKAVRDKINNYNAGVSIVTNLESIQEELNTDLAKSSTQIQKLESSLKASPTTIHVIESASLPIEKSRPRRSLYVIGISLLTLLMTMTLVLMKENISSVLSTDQK